MRIFSRPLLSVVFASSLAGYLQAIFMAYLGIRLKGLGAVALVIGWIFFSRNFFQIFVRVPFGQLAQIVGRKPMIISGNVLYVLAFLFMYIASSPLVVFIATFVLAIGMAMYYPALFSYIGDISDGDYGRINGFVFQGSDIGVILGTLLSSYLLRMDIVEVKGLFAIGTVIGVLGTAIVAITLSEVLPTSERLVVSSIWSSLKASLLENFHSLMEMTRTAPLGKIYMFQLVISFTEFFIGSFFPLMVVFHLGFADSEVSDILFFATIIVFFFKPYLGSISDKFGFRRPVLISLLINSILLVVVTYSTSLIIVIIVYSTMIASSITSYLAINGATSDAAPNSNRGMAMGALGFWVSFGRSASSAVLTPLWSVYEMTTGSESIALRNIFWIAGCIIFIALIVLYFMSKNLHISDTNSEEISSLPI